jgi:hypothetical protein
MCDYSLHLVSTRVAKVGDKLVTTEFSGSTTRGFSALGVPDVAVCLRPGTELAFDRDVCYERALRLFGGSSTGHRLARFRQVNPGKPCTHHDALEFPDGRILLVTQLRINQIATVLQLPAPVIEEVAFDLGDAAEALGRAERPLI